MSNVLQFDMCRKLKLAFADFSKRSAEQAEQTRRTVEQMAGYEAWGRNHKSEGPKRA